MAKTKLNHVPYRGAGPAMQDLLAGHVPVVFDGLGTSAPQIAGGTLRGLAITAPKRCRPCRTCRHRPKPACRASSSRPGTASSRKKGTPPEAIERMTKEVKARWHCPAIKTAWEKNGSDVPDVSGAEFAKLVSADVARWRKVVTDAGIKLE